MSDESTEAFNQVSVTHTMCGVRILAMSFNSSTFGNKERAFKSKREGEVGRNGWEGLPCKSAIENFWSC